MIAARSQKPARRILLVEDEPSLVLTLTDRLIAEGYEVETAGDGETGVELALQGSFDLVLLDRQLSDGLGPELIPLIRAQLPSCKVIVVSGSGHRDERGASECADAYFRKGEDLEELFEKIQTLLMT